MFEVTSNPYKFKYLQTGISGVGVEQVYLPEPPPDNEIHFKKEQRFIRPELDKKIRKAIKILYAKKDPDGDDYDPDYISPYQAEIDKWINQQYDRFEKGFWFWNNGVRTYLTPMHYAYLTEWVAYFGQPDYRETDKEICYWWAYIEGDKSSYGGLLNTIRRYGKSALMGFIIIWRTTRNFSHYSGMQGETDKKIKKFWDLHIIKPFRKMMAYMQPIYDYNSKQSEDIKFERPITRGKKSKIKLDDEDDFDDKEDLESYADYRESSEGAYDSAILHTYIMEEPGKTLSANVDERWSTVKPCLRKGATIRGKALLATTVEHMNVLDKGGKVYQKLFYESDFNKRTGIGQTISGLYAAFLPGDCAFEGYFDDYGHPLRPEARRSIILERESKKHNPKDYSALIRKYPLSIAEIFWVSSEQCVFNATILQERKLELDSSPVPMWTKFDLEWENKKRFSKIIIKHNPENGWYKSSWIFAKGEEYDKMANQVRKNPDGTYSPLNEEIFTAGIDPVDHRVVIQSRMGFGEDEFISTRRSKPVMLIKRRYDSSIDGIMGDHDEMAKKAAEKTQYKTGVYIGLMDSRPTDPNVMFERALMICWLHGMSMNVESAKPGVMNYFHTNGCADFIKQKYVPESKVRSGYEGEGTPANSATINEYTDCIAWYIDYFGHTMPFVDVVNDNLIFDPANTKVHDYSVAMGWCELGEKIRPKFEKREMMNIEDIMPLFDRNGNLLPIKRNSN